MRKENGRSFRPRQSPEPAASTLTTHFRTRPSVPLRLKLFQNDNPCMTHSSPAVGVLVHAQCHDCEFKASGTHEDVASACRAHRHPNSTFLVAMKSAQSKEVWTKHFEARPPLLTDTARLPKPYPRLYIWGTTLAALIVTGLGALLSRWLVRMWYPSMDALVHGSFMLLVVGGLIYTLLRFTNDRRAAEIDRFRTVAECNHHIRNALQVLSLTRDTRTQQGSPDVSRHTADSVYRIELTLAEVLPRVLQWPRTTA